MFVNSKKQKQKVYTTFVISSKVNETEEKKRKHEKAEEQKFENWTCSVCFFKAHRETGGNKEEEENVF